MGIFRGQGATEYLVLLAVVLIVALVSVALLGFFPGMASDARITQSQSYWRGQAKPFAIMDAGVTSSVGTFAVQNMEATGLTLTTFAVGNGTNSTLNTVFGAGETKTLYINQIIGTYAAGGVYDLNVTITYSTSSITGLKQYGTKNLIGKYT